jgi:hypothetical protein
MGARGFQTLGQNFFTFKIIELKKKMEPATKKAKTDSRARPYCGTWNNYTEEDRIRLLDYVNQPGGPTYILVGREVGKENGTPHLQCKNVNILKAVPLVHIDAPYDPIAASAREDFRDDVERYKASTIIRNRFFIDEETRICFPDEESHISATPPRPIRKRKQVVPETPVKQQGWGRWNGFKRGTKINPYIIE